MTAEHLTMKKALRYSFAYIMAEWLQDEEFFETVQDKISFKERDKYRNWYLGISKLALSYIENGSHKYKMHTTDSAGQISTPWFGKEFEETKFFRRVDYTYNISLPSEATNKTMVLEMMLDTKETKGAIDEIRIFSPEGYGNELMNFLVQKMKAGDIGYMKGTTIQWKQPYTTFPYI